MARTAYTEEFETFWCKFPARWNRDRHGYVKRKKQPAFMKWQKLPQEIRNECLAKVHLVKKSEGSASGVRDCVTWLNQAGWDDITDEWKPAFPSSTTQSIFRPVNESKVDVNAVRNKHRKDLGL